MNDENIQNLINMNYRVLTLLGMASALFYEIRHNLPESEHWKFTWLDEAVSNVVYENKPIPPFASRA